MQIGTKIKTIEVPNNESIRVFRLWRIGIDKVLHSTSQSYSWVNKNQVARCTIIPSLGNDFSLISEENHFNFCNGCGLYGMYDPHNLNVNDSLNAIAGSIECYGAIHLYELGLRAQFATLSALALCRLPYKIGGESSYDIAEQTAFALDVPLYDSLRLLMKDYPMEDNLEKFPEFKEYKEEKETHSKTMQQYMKDIHSSYNKPIPVNNGGNGGNGVGGIGFGDTGRIQIAGGNGGDTGRIQIAGGNGGWDWDRFKTASEWYRYITITTNTTNSIYQSNI